MERTRQPPVAIPLNEHEQGKLVECVRAARLLLAPLAERTPKRLIG
jgi:hypothetical protein